MSDAGDATHPVLLAWPYLSLAEPVEFGPWWLGPLAQYEGTWLDGAFEQRARAFLAGFRTVDGKQVANPSVLAFEGTIGSQLPPITTRQALRLAVGFGVLDTNPVWTEETSHDGWRVSTADAADLWVQPLAPGGSIALERGFRVGTQILLNATRDNFRIPAPLELTIRERLALDKELLHAIFQVLDAPTPEQQAHSDELRVAIGWLLKSWMNSPSISWEDRVVMSKTATEGIAQTDKNAKAVTRLRKRYAASMSFEPVGVGVDDLLWSPDEGMLTRQRRGSSIVEEVTAFEHWYWALAEARNDIVHSGSSEHLYYSAGTAYDGPIVETASRVLRELIKITVGLCGYRDVWRSDTIRAVLKTLDEHSGHDGGGT